MIESTVEGSTQRDKIMAIARALSLTPTDRTDIRRGEGLTTGSGWWLCGCKEGDQPLPQTSNAHTVDEAIDCAIGWLQPEIHRMCRYECFRSRGGGREMNTFCVECGFDVNVDQDECCTTCGCAAMGEAVDRLYAMRQENEEMKAEIAELETRHFETCSKMRPDNFAGGAVAVSAKEKRWLHTSTWATTTKAEMEKAL